MSYSDGKIYMIKSLKTNNVYIGSTVNSLNKRLNNHLAHFNSWRDKKNTSYCSSFIILEFGDAYIRLLEDYPCSSKTELARREGEHLAIYKDTACNIRQAGRTIKEYYNDNKAHLLQCNRIYYKNNKEHIQNYLKKHIDRKSEYDRKRHLYLAELKRLREILIN